MDNNFDILKFVTRDNLSNFVSTYNNKGIFSDSLVLNVSQKLIGNMPLGFCRRVVIFFTFDQQEIARIVAGVAKKYFDDLSEQPGAASIHPILPSKTRLYRTPSLHQAEDLVYELPRAEGSDKNELWREKVYELPGEEGSAMLFGREADAFVIGQYVAQALRQRNG